MKNATIEDIKVRREKMKISQQRLVKEAKISLATLEQLELGNQKPQSRTIKKILTALEKFESTDPASLAESAPKRKRGRPRKTDVKNASVKPMKGKPEKVAAGKPKETPDPTIQPTVDPQPTAAVTETAVVTAEVGQSIKLSNIDLELINRILNMTGLEKLDLLKKLM